MTTTRDRIAARRRLPLCTAALALALLGQVAVATPVDATPTPSTWYVSADGDDANAGTSRNKPFLTLGMVEAVSAPGDKIVVLASSSALVGGIVLKSGQELIGRGDNPGRDDDADRSSGSYAVISNPTAAERDGHAVTCAGPCVVSRVWLDGSFGSGISAVGGTGDVTVVDVRITDFNTGGATISIPALGGGPDLSGIYYERGADGEVTIRDSYISGGQGSGVVAVSTGSADLGVEVDGVTVRRPSSSDFSGGIEAFATDDSDLSLEVWHSSLSELGVGISAIATDSGRIHTDARHNDIRFAELGISTFSPIAPTALSAVIKHNTMSDVVIGINHNSQSSGTPDVQRVVIEHNVVSASNSGVTYEHGTFFPGIDLTDHKADVVIRHNDFTITGDPFSGFGLAFPLLVNTNVGGNELLTALIEHNTIVGGPNLPLVNPGTIGVFIGSFAEPEHPATMHTIIRKNHIRLGPDTRAIGFSGNVGLRALVQELSGFPGSYLPPYTPGWDVTMKVEQNCVEATGAGFATSSALGWELGDLTLDLGGGELGSKGRNRFIDTDVGILFAAPFFAGAGPPSAVPDTQIIARQNYWGGSDAVVVDENGLIGTPGYPDGPDTTGFLTHGPDRCGSL